MLLNGPDSGLNYAIPVGRLELGRAPEAAIWLDDLNVSREHAVLESTEHRVVLIDLGSINGTWVNNRRLTGPCPLRDGDVVQLGTVILQFRAADDDSPLVGVNDADTGPGGVAFSEVREPDELDADGGRFWKGRKLPFQRA